MFRFLFTLILWIWADAYSPYYPPNSLSRSDLQNDAVINHDRDTLDRRRYLRRLSTKNPPGGSSSNHNDPHKQSNVASPPSSANSNGNGNNQSVPLTSASRDPTTTGSQSPPNTPPPPDKPPPPHKPSGRTKPKEKDRISPGTSNKRADVGNDDENVGSRSRPISRFRGKPAKYLIETAVPVPVVQRERTRKKKKRMPKQDMDDRPSVRFNPNVRYIRNHDPILQREKTPRYIRNRDPVLQREIAPRYIRKRDPVLQREIAPPEGSYSGYMLSNGTILNGSWNDIPTPANRLYSVRATMSGIDGTGPFMSQFRLANERHRQIAIAEALRMPRGE